MSEGFKMGLTKANITSFSIGHKPWTIGIKGKMSLVHGGTGIPQRPTKRYYHLRDLKYMVWRSKVFKRDGYTCQGCGKNSCYLEPHHIKGWAKYIKLRYVVSNGLTLCKDCHTSTRRRKN